MISSLCITLSRVATTARSAATTGGTYRSPPVMAERVQGFSGGKHNWTQRFTTIFSIGCVARHNEKRSLCLRISKKRSEKIGCGEARLNVTQMSRTNTVQGVRR